jgi:hypothetical protein
MDMDWGVQVEFELALNLECGLTQLQTRVKELGSHQCLL